MTKQEIIKEIIGNAGCDTCKFETECRHMRSYIRAVTTDVIDLCDVLNNSFNDYPDL